MRAVIVKRNETLQKIAERELGSFMRWPELYAANPSLGCDARNIAMRQRFPRSLPADWIFPGQVLAVPGRWR